MSRIAHLGDAAGLGLKPSAAGKRPSKGGRYHEAGADTASLCWLFLAAAILVGSCAEAAEVGHCNELDRVSLRVGQTRSFAGGKITLAHVDRTADSAMTANQKRLGGRDP